MAKEEGSQSTTRWAVPWACLSISQPLQQHQDSFCLLPPSSLAFKRSLAPWKSMGFHLLLNENLWTKSKVLVPGCQVWKAAFPCLSGKEASIAGTGDRGGPGSAGGTLDSMILVAFPTLNDPMISRSRLQIGTTHSWLPAGHDDPSESEKSTD